MKKEDNYDDMMNFGDLISSLGGSDGPDSCSMLPMLTALFACPKPLGMIWDDRAIKEFLVKLGYKFLSVTGDTGGEIEVVVKPEDSTIPTTPNIVNVFELELQRLFLDFLLKFNGIQ